MIYNSDEVHRRTLKFPAVKPCEFISSTTLINSLIDLSNNICKFKSIDFKFTSNKRNAKITLRLIEVFLVFIEEIRDWNSNLTSKSVISSLLEIHVILQKIHFLLVDCTRQDARVWMLMNSRSVANHFRILVGSLATALDVLPLDLMCVPDEARDYLGFVITQGKRGRFEFETDDVRVSNLVVSILNQFEKKAIPSPSDLRRVMEYLGINKWSDCNNQIKFLEEEIGFSDSELATSLLKFMVYCRCVIFDNFDGDRRIENKRDDHIVNFLNSDDFRCPISLEIMMDPITIPSGHTYDRSSILKWFKLGNSVCPKTGQRLQSLDLVPNLALKKLIHQYCLVNGIPIPKSEGNEKIIAKSSDFVGSLAGEQAMKMVADFLSIKLAMGTMVERNKAAYEIRLLTKRSLFNRACFVESGVIPYLLNLLLSKDSTAQENSMAALLNLSKNSESKPMIINNGGLKLVIGVLKSGIKMEARRHAAATLFYLSSVEEYRRSIGNNPNAIPSLLELIRVGGDRGKKNALVAIYGLLMLPSNHHRVLEARLIPLLVTLLDSMESEDLIVDSLAILSTMAEKPDGAKAITRAKALDVIVGILCSSSDDSSRFGREHCVSLLLSLCINCGREVVEVLVKNTSLMGALYSLLTDGTSRASKKASSLINILLEFSERSSSQSMPHALPHENFIHVW